jgi:outer membrane protein insertion porin family
LEAEFPIGLPEEYGITGGVFYDAGSLWDVGAPDALMVNVESNDFIVRQVLGASIFWDTPIGPLRFNWSEIIAKEDQDSEQSFELTISTEF